MKSTTIVRITVCALALSSCADDSPQLPDASVPVSDAIAAVDQSPQVEPCPELEVGATPHGDLYNHQIEYAKSQGNPTSFTPMQKVLLEHASVPDATYGPDGEVWVYAINANPGQHAIFISRQDGDKLTTFDCVRIDGKVNGNAVDPDIVRQDDGTYRLFYYQGYFVDGPPPPGAKHPMYNAVSTDGIHFTSPQKLLEFDSISTDPSAIHLEGDTWLMVVTGDSTRLAKSTDNAKTFQLTGKEWDNGIPELAIFDDGTIRLYLASMDGLGIYKSDDKGESWAKETTLNGFGPDPSLLHNPDGTITLYYKTFAEKR
jgi:hypothetical protein